MAVTGLLMVLFVVGHLLGNLTIFAGQNGLNAYAAKLHEVAPLVWGTRIVMGVALVLHVVLAIQITMENSAAKPQNYARPNYLRATFSSKTMIWTGVIIAVFVGYHLLQFTIRKTPGLVLGTDALNRFDVYTMVVAAFQRTLTSLLYVVAMVSLFLHLGHGIQSAFQTLGLSNGMLLPRFELAGKVVSGIFLVGFASIPVFILIGFLPR